MEGICSTCRREKKNNIHRNRETGELICAKCYRHDSFNFEECAICEEFRYPAFHIDGWAICYRCRKKVGECAGCKKNKIIQALGLCYGCYKQKRRARVAITHPA